MINQNKEGGDAKYTNLKLKTCKSDPSKGKHPLLHGKKLEDL